MKVRKMIITLILSFLLFSNTSAHCLKEIETTARAQIAITQCELLKISNKVILDAFQIPSVPANGEMPKSGEEIEKEENEIEILAKLLFCEAGAASWDCQVYVCSAILNLSEYTGRSIWDIAHDINTMAVAPYVDYASPLPTQYNIIEYVMGEGKIEGVMFFRTSYYHPFGTPICSIDNVYFSSP